MGRGQGENRLNDRELYELFCYCDLDGSGALDIGEFMFSMVVRGLSQKVMWCATFCLKLFNICQFAGVLIWDLSSITFRVKYYPLYHETFGYLTKLKRFKI